MRDDAGKRARSRLASRVTDAAVERATASDAPVLCSICSSRPWLPDREATHVVTWRDRRVAYRCPEHARAERLATGLRAIRSLPGTPGRVVGAGDGDRR
jgi:hypothetical protein